MRREDYTGIGGVQEAFLTTHWSFIDEISTDQTDQNRALIELLLVRYWKPVYCYLRRRGYSNEDAKDLTQGFFQEVVLGRKLVAKADQTKGRFRSFLLVALNRYVINVEQEQAARKRAPSGRLVSLDLAGMEEVPQAMTALTPEDAFTYAWVSALLEQVLEDVQAGCERDGKRLHWQVFHDRLLQPVLQGGPAPALENICNEYGLADPATASNMIVTVKRRFRTALAERLRDSVMSDEEAEAEFQEIKWFLPRLAQDGP
ncbi:MAG: sigma-70 family RNA polymerase sigma factor [Sedimentisphaerales bacterium]|nr:sigma-70 family RNA polymerase sigma factor [Sedimentisphaerales bacterium]